MRHLLHPTDSAGIPRHFGSHREAFLWVSGSLARYGIRLIFGYVSGAVVWLAWSIWQAVSTDAPLDLFPPEAVLVVIVAVTFPLLFWVLGSILIYVYLVLSGVVASRVGRERAAKAGERDEKQNRAN